MVIITLIGLYCLFKYKMKIYSMLFWIIYKVFCFLAVIAVITSLIARI